MSNMFYAYDAALLCGPCGEAAKAGLRPDEDSNNYPQGPYVCGGAESESDTPQHCDVCCRFLRNRLTRDGVEYVIGKLAERDPGAPFGYVLGLWVQFYIESNDDILDAALGHKRTNVL